MSSVQSVVLGLLEKSSLPGLYKSMLKNLLPNMTRMQQEELLVILHGEKSKKESLKIKMEDTHWRYSNILQKLEEDPTAYDEEFNKIVGSRSGLKDMIEAGGGKGGTGVGASKTKSGLSALKSKLALKKLKKNL